jgi:hypothetical protein
MEKKRCFFQRNAMPLKCTVCQNGRIFLYAERHVSLVQYLFWGHKYNTVCIKDNVVQDSDELEALWFDIHLWDRSSTSDSLTLCLMPPPQCAIYFLKVSKLKLETFSRSYPVPSAWYRLQRASNNHWSMLGRLLWQNTTKLASFSEVARSQSLQALTVAINIQSFFVLLTDSCRVRLTRLYCYFHVNFF